MARVQDPSSVRRAARTAGPGGNGDPSGGAPSDAALDTVHRLLQESLVTFGVLAVGWRETIRFTQVEQCSAHLDPREKLYRKVA